MSVTRAGRRAGPLSEPQFARLWLAGVVSEAGDWLLLVALPVYVLQITGSTRVTATVFLLGLLPGLVVGPLAGVLVDRWPRRRTLVLVSLAQATVLLALLTVHGRGQLWVIYAVTAAEAALAHLFEPAKNALLPTLVAPGQLAAANGLIGLSDNLARLVGGPLGGVVLALSGLPGVVLADVGSFLLAAALLTTRRVPARGRIDISDASPQGPAGEPPHGPAGEPVHRPAAEPAHRPVAEPSHDIAHLGGKIAAAIATPEPAQTAAATDPQSPTGLYAQWLTGLAALRGDHRQLAALTVTALAAFAQGIFVVLFVVFVVRRLQGGGAEVGLLRGVQAVGALGGGVLLARYGHLPAPMRMVGASLLVFGLLSLMIWNSPMLTTEQWLYVVLFVAVGAPGIGISAGLTTFVGSISPERLRGRVFSAYLTVSDGFEALGMLAAGLLAAPLGLLALLNGEAVVYLLAGIVALTALSRTRGRRRAASGLTRRAAGQRSLR